MNRKLGALITLAILCKPNTVSADDVVPEPLPGDSIRLTSGDGMLEIAARRFVLPQGTRILTPPAFERLDVEMRRLQDVETRLTAENLHMKTATRGWQPGWKVLAITAVSALASGIYLGYKL
jgi:hypothetical protein